MRDLSYLDQRNRSKENSQKAEGVKRRHIENIASKRLRIAICYSIVRQQQKEFEFEISKEGN